jgi:translocation and assembly module TamA
MKSTIRNIFLALALMWGFGAEAATPSARRTQRVCEPLTLHTPEEISFSDTEIRLLCGDPHNDAWNNLPASQILFNLRSFLQERGFFLTEVEQTRPFIIVNLGSPTIIKVARWHGVPKDVDVSRLRHLVDVRLTPKFLDEAKQRTEQLLRTRGYPCATVDITADPKTEIMELTVDPGTLREFGVVTPQPIHGIDGGILRRYDAFHPGEPYNDDNLVITTRRMMNAGIVQTTHFSPNCADDSTRVPINQSLLAGPPRNLTIGFGLDTERYARMRASWQHFRLGKWGSKTEVNALMAVQQQELNWLADWYYLPFVTHHFLRPRVTFKHADEKPFENFKVDAELSPAVQWDSQDYGFLATIGPAINGEHQYRPEVKDQYFASLRAMVKMTSHDFEFYQMSPRTGFNLSVMAEFTRRGVFSDVTAQRLEVNFEKLWNVLSFDPPVVVLGIRGGAASAFVPDAQGGPLAVPASLRSYLGGSVDLRGFERKALAGLSGSGTLSSAFFCFEGRLYDTLPWGLQPFLFTDFGMLGEESMSLNTPVYYSPGLGMRWQSPIGNFRFTVAKGELLGDPHGIPANLAKWHAFLSFGEEF